MFAALRAVRSQASAQPGSPRCANGESSAAHTDPHAGSPSALTASRRLSQARRDAVAATVRGRATPQAGPTTPTNHILSATLRSLQSLARTSVSAPGTSPNDTVDPLCAWVQLAASAILIARLDHVAQPSPASSSRSEEETWHAGADVVSAGRKLWSRRLARHRCSLQQLVGAVLACPPEVADQSPCLLLVTEARRCLGAAVAQSVRLEEVDQRRPPPLPRRAGRDRGGASPSKPVAVKRGRDEASEVVPDVKRPKDEVVEPVQPTTAAGTAGTRQGFAFGVRVGVVADDTASRTPNVPDQTNARSEASRKLCQTRLTAFTGGGSHASAGPSAAAVAVLREVRGASTLTSTSAAPYTSATATAPPFPTAAPSSTSLAAPPPPPSAPYFGDHGYASRKAPPYTAGAGEANSGGGGAPGGFVTAVEQLANDIRTGRANPASSSVLSRRSPALGLRRSGFQVPFQQQQQQQQPPPPPATSTGDTADTSLSVNKVLKAVAAPKQTNGPAGDDEDDAGSYPASLLLPDGSVPDILLPLDPKLVTQVAMEILEDGSGSKKIGWDDIAGLQHAKSSVEEAIVWPLRRPDLFVGLRDPPRGLLLFGPPGTGKTMIARAIANRTECTFLNISSSSLMSKWVGDGEKLVRCLFAVATVKQPSVIFIDEIDSLLSMRGEGEMDAVRRVKTEFLVQLDGVATDRGDRVLLIGATNRPDELDEAARRRMEKRLYIPLPDQAARRQLIQRLLFTLEKSVKADGGVTGRVQARNRDGVPEGGIPVTAEGAATGAPHTPAVHKVHALTDADLDHLARVTHGYSGADLKQLCREASMGPLREMSMGQLSEVAVGDLRPIDRRDFRHALKRLKPSVGQGEIARYETWNKQYGSFADNSDDDNDDDDTSDSDSSPTR